MNEVCAIIITYNCDRKIVDVIDSIKKQVSSVIIVDNGSKRESLEILAEQEKDSSVTIIYNEINYGIAKALNIGIKYAEEEGFKWVITLDHDTVCEEYMIEKMFNYIESEGSHINIGIICPRVYDINKKMYIDKVKKSSLEKDYVLVKDCIQSGSLYNINVFQNIGYFNEDLFIYHVDFDFCEKLINNNYKIVKCNKIKILHEEGAKVSKKIFGVNLFYNNYSNYAVYYITRNTIYMAKKYNIKYIKRIIKDFVFIILFDTRRVDLLTYWFKGVKDGITGRLGPINVD